MIFRFLISHTFNSRVISRSIMDLSNMRAQYRPPNDNFSVEDLVSKEPIGVFSAWFNEALSTPEILEPNAMCLATSTKDGFPSARYVLLKEFNKQGFKFFTNFTSRKAKELIENPRAALVFYWEPLRRSIRIEGTVEKVPDQESEKYFKSRPLDSQIGAIVSPQSQPIPSKKVLLEKVTSLKKEGDKGAAIDWPNHWGGFLVKPISIEFWQGHSDRLHDRIRFRCPTADEKPDGVILHLGEDGWVFECLAP